MKPSVHTTEAIKRTTESYNTRVVTVQTPAQTKVSGAAPLIETTKISERNVSKTLDTQEATLGNETNGSESEIDISPLTCPQPCSEADGLVCRLIADCRTCPSTFTMCVDTKLVGDIFKRNLFREHFCGPQGVVIYKKGDAEYLPFKCLEGDLCPNQAVCKMSFTDGGNYCCAQVENGGLVPAFSSGNSGDTSENAPFETFPPYVTYENQTYSLVIDYFTTPVPVTVNQPKLALSEMQGSNATSRQPLGSTAGRQEHHIVNPDRAPIAGTTVTPFFSLATDRFTTLMPVQFHKDGNPRRKRNTEGTEMRNIEPAISGSDTFVIGDADLRIDGENVPILGNSDNLNISIEYNKTSSNNSIEDKLQNTSTSKPLDDVRTIKSEDFGLLQYITDKTSVLETTEEAELISTSELTELPTTGLFSSTYETSLSTPVTGTSSESYERTTSALETTFSTMGTETFSSIESTAAGFTSETSMRQSESTAPPETSTNTLGFTSSSLASVEESLLANEDTTPSEVHARKSHSRRKRSYRYEKSEKKGNFKKEKPDCISVLLGSNKGDWNTKSLFPPASKLRPGGRESIISVVVVLRQISDVECLEEVTFFFMERILLVSDGCAALFLVCFQTPQRFTTPAVTETFDQPPGKATTPSPDAALRTTTTATRLIPGTGNQGCRTVVLRSSLYRRAQARFPINSEPISSMSLVRQFSSRACVRGINFDFDSSLATASRGCKGEFRICQGQTTPTFPAIKTTVAKATTSSASTTTKKPTCKIVTLISTVNDSDSQTILDARNSPVSITKVILVHELSDRQCHSLFTYDFQGAVITALAGCAGDFAVCYEIRSPDTDKSKSTVSATVGPRVTATAVSPQNQTSGGSPAAEDFSTPQPGTEIDMNQTREPTQPSKTERLLAETRPKDTEPTLSISSGIEPTNGPRTSPGQSGTDKTLNPTHQAQSATPRFTMTPAPPTQTIEHKDPTGKPSPTSGFINITADDSRQEQKQPDTTVLPPPSQSQTIRHTSKTQAPTKQSETTDDLNKTDEDVNHSPTSFQVVTTVSQSQSQTARNAVTTVSRETQTVRNSVTTVSRETQSARNSVTTVSRETQSARNSVTPVTPGQQTKTDEPSNISVTPNESPQSTVKPTRQTPKVTPTNGTDDSAANQDNTNKNFTGAPSMPTSQSGTNSISSSTAITGINENSNTTPANLPGSGSSSNFEVEHTTKSEITAATHQTTRAVNLDVTGGTSPTGNTPAVPPEHLECQVKTLSSNRTTDGMVMILDSRGIPADIRYLELLRPPPSVFGCEKGSTFLYQDSVLITKDGCQGLFEVCYLDSRCEVVELLSGPADYPDFYEFRPAAVEEGFRPVTSDITIRSLTVEVRLGVLPCREWESFYYIGTTIVVREGCHAIFNVCYVTEPV